MLESVFRFPGVFFCCLVLPPDEILHVPVSFPMVNYRFDLVFFLPIDEVRRWRHIVWSVLRSLFIGGEKGSMEHGVAPHLFWERQAINERSQDLCDFKWTFTLGSHLPEGVSCFEVLCVEPYPLPSFEWDEAVSQSSSHPLLR